MKQITEEMLGDKLMEKNEFRRLFASIAKKHGFDLKLKSWFKESNECIVFLKLQKSSLRNFYYLNIDVFAQMLPGPECFEIKNSMYKDGAYIKRREPRKYSDFLDFDWTMDDDVRKKGFEDLFSDFIDPFTNKALTWKGMLELEKNGERIFPCYIQG